MINSIKLSRNSVCLAAAIVLTVGTIAVFTAPLNAQDTVVEGSVERSNAVKEWVSYDDLDLRQVDHQQQLVTRVKKAARRVCAIAYEDEPIFVKLHNDCPSRSYGNAKPQIKRAIAAVQNGQRVAMAFSVAATGK